MVQIEKEVGASRTLKNTWYVRSHIALSKIVSKSKQAGLVLPGKLKVGRMRLRLYNRIGIVSWKRARFAIIALAILALVTLVVDGLLAFELYIHQHPGKASGVMHVPVLTIMPEVVPLGHPATLHLSGFARAARVRLTHDIEQPVRVNATSALVQVGVTGGADVELLVEGNWGAGVHTIEAEDINAHYTAQASVQVIGAGPALPPTLQVNQSFIDMGTDWSGETTLQSLLLRNTGGGIISWKASSNQEWLILTPTQGTFGDNQSLEIVVNRANLKTGKYSGIITFISNTSVPVAVRIEMAVQPPPVGGAILMVAPSVLAFTATDGERDPGEQTLTMSNAGVYPLHWSLDTNASSILTNQALLLTDRSWLTAEPASGVVEAGASVTIHIVVHSRALLPGLYTGTLAFSTGVPEIRHPQVVGIALNIQQRCGINPSVGNVTFVMAAQRNPHHQSIHLRITDGCSGIISWEAFSVADWIFVTPTNGRVQDNAGAATTLGVNGGVLSPGTYKGFVVFVTDQRTRTVLVQLTILQPGISGVSETYPAVTGSMENATPTQAGQGSTPAATTASATIVSSMGKSPVPRQAVLTIATSQVTFTGTQGQAHPASQSVTIVNTGGSQLNWQVWPDASTLSWLSIFPSAGSLAAGQAGQVTVNADISGLAVGSYKTQVFVTVLGANGVAVQGSSQVFTIELIVNAPCMLQVSSNNLVFSATLLQPNPSGRSITLSESGNCVYPITWSASVNAGSRGWLMVSRASGSDSGNGSSLTVEANTAGMILGSYDGQITIVATDNDGNTVQGSPQMVSVVLTVVG